MGNPISIIKDIISPPKAQPAPTPAPPPPVPTKDDAATAVADAEKKKRSAVANRNASGRASTILTSGLGVQEKDLLGS